MRNNPNRYARPNDHGFEDVREQGYGATQQTAAKLKPDPLLALERCGILREHQIAAAQAIRKIEWKWQSDGRAFWAPGSDRVDISLIPELQHTIQAFRAMHSIVSEVYGPWKREQQRTAVGRLKWPRWMILSDILLEDLSIKAISKHYAVSPGLVKWHLGKSLSDFADLVSNACKN